MGVRITSAMLLRTGLTGVSRQRQRLQVYQEQAASGLRINRPSDDPSGVRAAALLKEALARNASFERSIATSEPGVRATETALADANDVLVRAKELAIQGSNGTLDGAARASLAREVESLHERLVSIGNARSGGGFLFSGYTGDVQPFTPAGPFVQGSPSPGVSFTGDPNEPQVAIDEGFTVRVGLDGRRVFKGDGDGDGNPDAGRQDLFDILGDLRDALDADDPALVAAVLPRLDEGQDQLSVERTRIGATDAQLAAFRDRIGEREVQLTARLSDVQDADAAEVFSEIVNQEVALRASLDAASRMIQPSLLDFLA